MKNTHKMNNTKTNTIKYLLLSLLFVVKTIECGCQKETKLRVEGILVTHFPAPNEAFLLSWEPHGCFLSTLEDKKYKLNIIVNELNETNFIHTFKYYIFTRNQIDRVDKLEFSVDIGKLDDETRPPFSYVWSRENSLVTKPLMTTDKDTAVEGFQYDSSLLSLDTPQNDRKLSIKYIKPNSEMAAVVQIFKCGTPTGIDSKFPIDSSFQDLSYQNMGSEGVRVPITKVNYTQFEKTLKKVLSKKISRRVRSKVSCQISDLL